MFKKRFGAKKKASELVNGNSENISSSSIWGHLFQIIEKKWE